MNIEISNVKNAVENKKILGRYGSFFITYFINIDIDNNLRIVKKNIYKYIDIFTYIDNLCETLYEKLFVLFIEENDSCFNSLSDSINFYNNISKEINLEIISFIKYKIEKVCKKTF